MLRILKNTLNQVDEKTQKGFSFKILLISLKYFLCSLVTHHSNNMKIQLNRHFLLEHINITLMLTNFKNILPLQPDMCMCKFIMELADHFHCINSFKLKKSKMQYIS